MVTYGEQFKNYVFQFSTKTFASVVTNRNNCCQIENDNAFSLNTQCRFINHSQLSNFTNFELLFKFSKIEL